MQNGSSGGAATDGGDQVPQLLHRFACSLDFLNAVMLLECSIDF